MRKASTVEEASKAVSHEATTGEEASEVVAKEASTVEGCLKQYRMKLQPLRRRPKQVRSAKSEERR